MRRPRAIAAVLASVVAGCGPRVVALEPKQIASVQVLAPGGASMCANDDATPLREGESEWEST